MQLMDLIICGSRIVWEFNRVVEECWRQGKDNLLVSKYYPRFTNVKAAITNYYRTKRFELDIVKYLMRESASLMTPLHHGS